MEEGVAASGEREEGVEEGVPSMTERSRETVRREASRGSGCGGRRYSKAGTVEAGGSNQER